MSISGFKFNCVILKRRRGAAIPEGVLAFLLTKTTGMTAKFRNLYFVNSILFRISWFGFRISKIKPNSEYRNSDQMLNPINFVNKISVFLFVLFFGQRRKKFANYFLKFLFLYKSFFQLQKKKMFTSIFLNFCHFTYLLTQLIRYLLMFLPFPDYQKYKFYFSGFT